MQKLLKRLFIFLIFFLLLPLTGLSFISNEFNGNQSPDIEPISLNDWQFNPSMFDKSNVKEWKETILKADQNNNGIADQFEDKLNSLLKDGNLKGVESNNKKKLSKEDIIDGFLGNEKQELERISYEHIPVVIQFPKGDIDSYYTLFENLGGHIKSKYDIAINGFAGAIDYDGLNQFCTKLNHEGVPFLVEEDAIVKANLYYASRNMNLRPYVWNTLSYTGDECSSVAVIDTGLDDTHNFFTPGYSSGDFDYKIVGWRDEVNGLTSPYDDHGHGSHCAGIATGEGSPVLDGYGRTVATYSLGFDYTGVYYDYTYDIIAARFNVTEAGEVEIACDFNDYTAGADQVHVWVYLYHNEAIVDSYVVSTDSWNYNLSYSSTISTLGDYSLRIELVFDDNTGDGYVTDPHMRFKGEIHWPFNPPLFGGGDPWKGVAPDTHLVGVKVLDSEGYGSVGDIVDGLNWIITNKATYNITTISMSLGGGPGQTSMINAVNNAVDNGIVTVVAAGNDGGGGNNIGSPGDADNVITVTAMSDADNVTSYSSSGGSSYTGFTTKPDIMAPGGSYYNFSMFSTDTNDNDAGGEYPTDGFLNDLAPMLGTSMATPAVAGATNLLIEAMGGHQNWNYTGTEAKRVKALLLMTATETYPITREIDIVYSPLLDRGGKDTQEGYGRLNIDAALEVYTQELSQGSTNSAWLSSSLVNPFNKHALGCYADLISGLNYDFRLLVPEGADFDLHLYNNTASSIGEPVMLASSISSVLGDDETFTFTPTESGRYYLVAKAISGEGYANITYTVNLNAPILTDGSIMPITGNPSTLFTYSVNYSDIENNPPIYVNVSINDTYYVMSKQYSSDNDYTDGCIYQFSIYLQPGIYNYSFGCWDGGFYTSTPVQYNPTVSYTSAAPPSLINGQVNPGMGYNGTTMFEFSVNYADADNNQPEYINITINSTEYSMDKQNPLDNNYMDGCVYVYEIILDEIGTYTYYFNCSDGTFTASEGPYSGPIVNIYKLQNYSMITDYVYEWIDATSGTELFLGDDGYSRQTLPFNFKFYNDTFSTVYLGANGYLSFIGQIIGWTNDPIPSGDTDNRFLIAPFWDDLRPASGGGSGKIFVQNFSNCWVAEWLDIWHYPLGPVVGTFEVILYDSGDIIFNYDNINYIDGGYTCGLNFGHNISFYNTYQNLNNSIDDFSIFFTLYPPTSPSIIINNGDATTDSVLVTLTLSADGATEMCFRNGTIGGWTDWEPYATAKQLYLEGSINNTEYTIYVKFRNAIGEINPISDSILYLILNIPSYPSIIINNGDASTDNPLVTLTLSAINADEMCFRNWTAGTWTSWESYSTTKQLYLEGSTDNTLYTISVKFRNAIGETSPVNDGILFLITSIAPTNPSIVINNDDASTDNPLVTLTLSADGATEMCFRNGTTGTWTSWESYSTTKQLYLEGSTDNTVYTIYVKFRNPIGETSPVSDDILFLITEDGDGDGDGDGNDGPEIPGYPLELLIISIIGSIGIVLLFKKKRRLN